MHSWADELAICLASVQGKHSAHGPMAEAGGRLRTALAQLLV